MRSVFNNAMCAHVWAQQNQEEGRSNNTSFRGECFFSYREPIARIVQRGCGPARRRALLVTHRRFSVTTSGHTSGAWIAARHISPHFNVLDVGNTKHFCREAIPHRENLADYAERIASAFAEARRARTQKPWKVDGAIGLVNEANAYAAFFGLKRRYRMPANWRNSRRPRPLRPPSKKPGPPNARPSAARPPRRNARRTRKRWHCGWRAWPCAFRTRGMIMASASALLARPWKPRAAPLCRWRTVAASWRCAGPARNTFTTGIRNTWDNSAWTISTWKGM